MKDSDKISLERVLKMIDNIGSVNDKCVILVPSDICSMRKTSADAETAKEVLTKYYNYYIDEHEGMITTFEVYHQEYDKSGIIKFLKIGMCNKFINNFDPGAIGPLD